MRRFISNLQSHYARPSSSSSNASSSDVNESPQASSSTFSGLRHIGSSRSSRTQALDTLLAVPPIAREIALPDGLNAQINDHYINVAEDDYYSKQTASTTRQLQDIRRNLADSPICFYPFGGADALYPTLLGNSKLTILTGTEQWGGVDDIDKALDINKIGQSVYGMGLGGGYDGVRDWSEASEGYDFNPGTLGPLSITRAAVAQVFNGDRISSLSVSAFDLSEDGHLHFKDLENRNVNNDDVAFWLTNTQGKTKLYLYKRLSVNYADAHGIINNIHAFLARISQPGQILQLQKAIPESLFNYVDSRRLLAPPSELIKAVVCDAKQEYKNTSQPVFLNQGRMRQQSIPLRSVSSPYSWIGPSFGYGENVFIHRPV